MNFSPKSMLAVLLLLCAVVIDARAQEPEHSVDLGHGYALLTFAEPGGASFESIGHFQYFCYNGRRLCGANIYSISPSAVHAAYFDDRTSDVSLFTAAASQVTTLIKKSASIPATFEWNEKESLLVIHFKDNSPPLKIPLK